MLCGAGQAGMDDSCENPLLRGVVAQPPGMGNASDRVPGRPARKVSVGHRGTEATESGNRELDLGEAR